MDFACCHVTAPLRAYHRHKGGTRVQQRAGQTCTTCREATEHAYRAISHDNSLRTGGRTTVQSPFTTQRPADHAHYIQSVYRLLHDTIPHEVSLDPDEDTGGDQYE